MIKNILIFISFSVIITSKSDLIHSRLPIISKMVAHAAGGINNLTYTNSYEALNLNYKKGFRYFEIDFSFTNDNKLVCVHNWEKDYIDISDEYLKFPLSYNKFNEINEKRRFRKCTLKGLLNWINLNPDSYIITDVKMNNMKALKIIKKYSKDDLNKFIPQIYNPLNFELVKKLGFKKVIWTLYKYHGNDQDIIKNIKKFYGHVAITIPIYRLNKKLIKELHKLNVSVYTHTINNKSKYEQLKKNYHIDNIYTDFISPKINNAY